MTNPKFGFARREIKVSRAGVATQARQECQAKKVRVDHWESTDATVRMVQWVWLALLERLEVEACPVRLVQWDLVAMLAPVALIQKV